MSEHMDEAVLESMGAFCMARGCSAALHPHTALGSLGISSLQLIELIYELEVRFELQVDEERLARLQTVADLQAMFSSARAASAEGGPQS